MNLPLNILERLSPFKPPLFLTPPSCWSAWVEISKKPLSSYTSLPFNCTIQTSRTASRFVQQKYLNRKCYYPYSPFHRQEVSVGTCLHSTSLCRSQARWSSSNRSKKSKDVNAPLLNEHLVAKLLTRHTNQEGSSGISNRSPQEISADSYHVRLIVEEGKDHNKEKSANHPDDTEDSASENEPVSHSQIVTLNGAIDIAHKLKLDLMEVSIQQDIPVIKAVDFDKWLYKQKRKESDSKKSKSSGFVSDKPVKEFKFRAGIADHDLERKASNMLEYLSNGHAVRVVLTARQRMLREDAQAITTTLDRVREIIGDKAVEAKGMKSNEKGNFGELLLHPNLKKK